MSNTDPIKEAENKRKWRSNNPEKWKKHNRTATLKTAGWTEEMYVLAHCSQKGLCSICGREVKGNMAADHDHSTMQPRELLCKNCNTGIGMLMDDPKLLDSAAAYLRKHGK
jgi:DNA-directed RNA polymerase subunit RPC12/RpoP